MRGYLDDPERRPLDDDLGPDGWLATGDVGWLDDAGNLRIVDRLNDLIIVGGFNTSPAEIERVLGEHPRSRRRRSSAFPTTVSARCRARSSCSRRRRDSTKPGCSPGPTSGSRATRCPRHTWFVDDAPADRRSPRSTSRRSRPTHAARGARLTPRERVDQRRELVEGGAAERERREAELLAEPLDLVGELGQRADEHVRRGQELVDRQVVCGRQLRGAAAGVVGDRGDGDPRVQHQVRRTGRPPPPAPSRPSRAPARASRRARARRRPAGPRSRSRRSRCRPRARPA